MTPDELAEVRARVDAANAEVSRLCSGPDAGRWRMSIPAREDRDSDLVIDAALQDVPRLLALVDAMRSEDREKAAHIDRLVGKLDAARDEVELLRTELDDLAALRAGAWYSRLTNAQADLAAARADLAHRAVLWECPECAFGFDSTHVNADGSGYSCPLCDLARRDAALAAVRELLSTWAIREDRQDVRACIEAVERAAITDAMGEATCHCGEPLHYGFDGDPSHHRGMCTDCDAVRCDAHPGECGR